MVNKWKKEDLIQWIKNNLLGRTFRVSYKLLAKEGNVSEETIRLWLRELESKGYIERLPKRGYYAITDKFLLEFFGYLGGRSPNTQAPAIPWHQLSTIYNLYQSIVSNEKIFEETFLEFRPHNIKLRAKATTNAQELLKGKSLETGDYVIQVLKADIDKVEVLIHVKEKSFVGNAKGYNEMIDFLMKLPLKLNEWTFRWHGVFLIDIEYVYLEIAVALRYFNENYLPLIKYVYKDVQISIDKSKGFYELEIKAKSLSDMLSIILIMPALTLMDFMKELDNKLDILNSKIDYLIKLFENRSQSENPSQPSQNNNQKE